MVKGGGRPFAGDDKQANFVSGSTPGTCRAANRFLNSGAAAERQLQIWLTPHGFLKAAMENNATAKKGAMGTEITFHTGKYTVTGTIDAHDMVTKTETWVPNPVLGDMPVVTTFSGYKDFGGVKFPTMIVQKQGGQAVLELNVSSVNANPGLSVSVPDSVKTATAPPIKVQSEKLADGIWFVGGGSHNSMVVEFPTYITVIEGPLGEARSLAVIAEAKRLVPNKPIKYLINTHSHFDHSGGVRTYVAEGATIITQEINVPFYQKAWAAPRTLAPDNLSKSGQGSEIPSGEGKIRSDRGEPNAGNLPRKRLDAQRGHADRLLSKGTNSGGSRRLHTESSGTCRAKRNPSSGFHRQPDEPNTDPEAGCRHGRAHARNRRAVLRIAKSSQQRKGIVGGRQASATRHAVGLAPPCDVSNENEARGSGSPLKHCGFPHSCVAIMMELK